MRTRHLGTDPFGEASAALQKAAAHAAAILPAEPFAERPIGRLASLGSLLASLRASSSGKPARALASSLVDIVIGVTASTHVAGPRSAASGWTAAAALAELPAPAPPEWFLSGDAQSVAPSGKPPAFSEADDALDALLASPRGPRRFDLEPLLPRPPPPPRRPSLGGAARAPPAPVLALEEDVTPGAAARLREEAAPLVPPARPALPAAEPEGAADEGGGRGAARAGGGELELPQAAPGWQLRPVTDPLPRALAAAASPPRPALTLPPAREALLEG
eukprot:tig00000383_g24691.t1